MNTRFCVVQNDDRKNIGKNDEVTKEYDCATLAEDI